MAKEERDVAEIEAIIKRQLSEIPPNFYKYKKEVINDNISGTIFEIQPVGKKAPILILHTWNGRDMVDVQFGEGFSEEYRLSKRLDKRMNDLMLLEKWLRAGLEGSLEEQLFLIGKDKYKIESILRVGGRPYVVRTIRTASFMNEGERSQIKKTYESYFK